MTQTLAEIMAEEDAKRVAHFHSPEGQAENARLDATLKLTDAERDSLSFPDDEAASDD